jgi:hypothetical protein
VAPTLVASYAVYANAQNANTLTTPSFSPANGEILIIKLATWSTTTSMSAPTGGGQTYQSAIIAAPGGFTPWEAIYFVNGVSGSPGSMTISSTPSASSWHGMVVERWSGATMDATPAVNGTINGTGAPSVTLTTTAANSVISTVSGDAQSNDPTGHAYLSSATEDGLQDGHVGSNGVTYYYWQNCGAAGSQTVGMSAPGGQKWALAAIEIKNASTPLTLTDTPLAGARAGNTTDTLVIGVTLADAPLPGVRAGSTTDTLAIGVALADLPSGVRAGNTVDTLTGQLVGTGADFDIGGVSVAWSAGPVSVGWAAQLAATNWAAGAVEV